MDERVARYFSLYSWLFSTIVGCDFPGNDGCIKHDSDDIDDDDDEYTDDDNNGDNDDDDDENKVT